MSVYKKWGLFFVFWFFAFYVVVVINQAQFYEQFFASFVFYIYTVQSCSQQKENMSKQQQEACE